MHVSLYRKYRPQKFAEVVGQDAATSLLRSSFADGRLGHAYLFSGPRGCGKTTAARLLAKLVNCDNPSAEGEPCCLCPSCCSVVAGEHMDVMEIDGASNRGIDQIRELKSHVGLASFMGGSKVYILDEVHMLTMEAFNALLKTLEEPPAAVLFIFATTEPHKVPVTIRSRCQHIPFHRISTENMVLRLREIAAAEGFPADDPALWEIARSADGALRDALSLAEQAVALGGGSLTTDAMLALFGGSSRPELERWVTLLRADPGEATVVLKALLEKGVSPERFLDALFPLLRDMWVYSLWGDKAFAGLSLSEEEQAFVRSETPHWTSELLRRASAVCTALFPRARWGLRSEVFSALFLFEMMGIFDERAPVMSETPSVPTPARAEAPPTVASTRAPEPVAEAPRTPPVRKRPDEVSPPAAVRFERREETAEPCASSAPQDLPALMQALWENDLPLCAALIDVEISLSDGALAFDCQNASPMARAVLDSARSRNAIARALGLKRTEDETAEARSAPPVPRGAPQAKREEPAGNGAKRTGVARRDMSMEELSAYLGAELLVSRPVAAGADTEEEEGEEIYRQQEDQE